MQQTEKETASRCRSYAAIGLIPSYLIIVSGSIGCWGYVNFHPAASLLRGLLVVPTLIVDRQTATQPDIQISLESRTFQFLQLRGFLYSWKAYEEWEWELTLKHRSSCSGGRIAFPVMLAVQRENGDKKSRE